MGADFSTGHNGALTRNGRGSVLTATKRPARTLALAPVRSAYGQRP
jgi:hypothetical protein